MNCETCNYKKANINKGVIEIKPNNGYVFLINTEEYDMQTAIEWYERLCRAFPNNGMAIMPADIIQSVNVASN